MVDHRAFALALLLAVSACTGEDPGIINTLPLPDDASTNNGSDASWSDGPVTPDASTREAGAKCEIACDGNKAVCVDGVCSSCLPGAKECVGETPRTCDALGEWVSGAACTGATPVCTSGICAATRLTGGIDGLGQRPAPSGTIRLKNDGFQRTPRACGATICVRGGITP